jgi:membrane protein
LTWVTFFLAYQLLPNTKIQPTTSLISALTAGTFWEFAKYGFDLYIANVPTYNKIYGSLGIIPIFLLWIYYSWIVVLFGAELTYIMHKPYKPFKKIVSMFSYPEIIALKIIYHISKRFMKEDMHTSLKELTDKIDAEEYFIKEVLNYLYQNKIIVKLDNETESYVLAKSLEHLKISEIIGVFKGSILSYNQEDFLEEKELTEILYKIKSETHKIIEDTTLKDIIST